MFSAEILLSTMLKMQLQREPLRMCGALKSSGKQPWRPRPGSAGGRRGALQGSAEFLSPTPTKPHGTALPS